MQLPLVLLPLPLLPVVVRLVVVACSSDCGEGAAQAAVDHWVSCRQVVLPLRQLLDTVDLAGRQQQQQQQEHRRPPHSYSNNSSGKRHRLMVVPVLILRVRTLAQA